MFLAWKFLAGVASVVLLILLGVLLAVILSGPVEALHRYKVPKPISSPLIVVSVLAAVLLIGYLFLPQFSQQGTQLSFNLTSAIDQLINRVEQFASRFGLSLDLSQGFSLTGILRQLSGGVLGLFSTLIFFVAGVVAAIFLGVYLAAKPGPVVDWIVRLFPPDRRPRTREVLSESRSSLVSWFGGQLISMTIIGVLSIIALWLIGIPGAVILGILSGLLEFVPYIGPIVSAVPPALLGLTLGNPIDGLYVIVAYLLIQQIESNIVTPLVYRETVDVHPAATIAVVLLLGTVFGLLGALLAIPIAVVAMVLVKELWFRRLEGGQEEEEEGQESAKEKG